MLLRQAGACGRLVHGVVRHGGHGRAHRLRGALQGASAHRSVAVIESLGPKERRAALGNRAVDALAKVGAEYDAGFGREQAL